MIALATVVPGEEEEEHQVYDQAKVVRVSAERVPLVSQQTGHQWMAQQVFPLGIDHNHERMVLLNVELVIGIGLRLGLQFASIVEWRLLTVHCGTGALAGWVEWLTLHETAGQCFERGTFVGIDNAERIFQELEVVGDPGVRAVMVAYGIV